MDQHQHSSSGKDGGHDIDFNVPAISLLGDKQWLRIQRWHHLTDRELQVAELVCRGFNNEVIAAKLKIKYGTVKTHIQNIYRKVHIKNKIQMILKFVDTAAKFTVKSDTSVISMTGRKKSDKETSFSSNKHTERL